jgi:hypothetical protein
MNVEQENRLKSLCPWPRYRWEGSSKIYNQEFRFCKCGLQREIQCWASALAVQNVGVVIAEWVTGWAERESENPPQPIMKSVE